MSTFCQFEESGRRTARVVAEVISGLLGIALLTCAILADHAWLDRHFLPSFFVSRRVYVLALTSLRIVTAAIGLSLALTVRARIGHLVARESRQKLFANIFFGLLAVVLALGTSELVLRRVFRHSAQERPADEVPFRRPDLKLGWIFVPSSTGRDTVGGCVVEYSFDPAGYRVRRADMPVDTVRPTIVFTGESIIVGHGLTWDESIPAQVAALSGIQSANLAVHGYANDQAYLRLAADLPHFRQPVAVVSLFMSALFDRNLDDDRPHLGPELEWLPARPRWRLTAIANLMFPYRSDPVIERGMAMTRKALHTTAELATARGAVPLIVVPQFGPEDPSESVLRHRILDGTGLAYVWVQLDPSWRIPGDRHPDSRGAHAIAAAVAARLCAHPELNCKK